MKKVVHLYYNVIEFPYSLVVRPPVSSPPTDNLFTFSVSKFATDVQTYSQISCNLSDKVLN